MKGLIKLSPEQLGEGSAGILILGVKGVVTTLLAKTPRFLAEYFWRICLVEKKDSEDLHPSVCKRNNRKDPPPVRVLREITAGLVENSVIR
jgi:hypothetical protein